MLNINRRQFLKDITIASLLFCHIDKVWARKKNISLMPFIQFGIIKWPHGFALDYFFIINNNLWLIASSSGQIVLLSAVLKGKNNVSVINEYNNLFTKILYIKQLKNNQFIVFSQSSTENSYNIKKIIVKNNAVEVISSLELPLKDVSAVLNIDIENNLLALVIVDNLGKNLLYLINFEDIQNCLNNINNYSYLLNCRIDSCKIINKNVYALTGVDKTFVSHYSIINDRLRANRDLDCNGLYDEANNCTNPNQLNNFYNFMANYKNYICLASLNSDKTSNLTILEIHKHDEFLLKTKIKLPLKIKYLTIVNKKILILGYLNDKCILLIYSINGSKIAEYNLSTNNSLLKEQNFNNLISTAKNVLISSNWLGILNFNPNAQYNNFEITSVYNPKIIPASCVAINNKYIIIGSSEFKFYEITKKSFELVKIFDPQSQIKDLYILDEQNFVSLENDSLFIRSILNPATIVQSYPGNVEKINYDIIQKKYFTLSSKLDKYQVDTLNYQNQALNFERSQVLAKINTKINRMVVFGGYLLLASLHKLFLYGINQDIQELASYSISNFAIRDIAVNESYIFISCIDENLNSYIHIIAKDCKSYNVIVQIVLPHDGITLAIDNNYLLTCGKNKSGTDIVQIYDIKNINSPNCIQTFNTVSLANKISSFQNQFCIAGLGLQLLIKKF